MDITDRHEMILQKLKEEGRVKINDLIEWLNVSGVTIRKDLKLLEDKKLLFRTHGGASSSNPYMNERTIDEKEQINAEAKQKIGKAALGLIKESDSVIVGSGTTVYTFANMLHPLRQMTVITPAVKVTLALCSRPNIEIVQLGGTIRPNSSSVAGRTAENTLEEISSGILFLGVDGIDLDFGLSITNLAEASLNKKMIESAQVLVVLADSSKFGKRGLGKVCGLEQVHYIVTDAHVPPAVVKDLEGRDINVIIAD
ncbi:DeoR/GlpR family DNA-binding transcription regulator [Sinomicrobium soli]|uniref:DeoR/GlpR family DNA-binding transcription regulator n=1 Tax=Sinomicrobium sp. N-1-3-6 TaxID=2219864 RepID=UPI000DCDD1C2|nr:DeoR/GlpR family DNA-binding transcription regulator [Sinomicrobium sp. N-1-3-6]RAV28402.1 transcriptional regulator [Sinomicrobium sp. N-1-3-6]